MIKDFSADRTLPGNPHGTAAQEIDDAAYPAAAIREALLAVAFEIRTANLLAADQQDGVSELVAERITGQS